MSQNRILRFGFSIISAVLLAAACGTGLSDEELRAAVIIEPTRNTSALPGPAPGSDPLSLPSGSATGGAATAAPTAGQAATPGASDATPLVRSGAPAPAAGPATAPTGGKATTGRQPQTPASDPGAPSVGPGAAAPTKRSEIVLGSFGTQSGPIGSAVASGQPGARAWVASVNSRGGLNGHPVRVIFADDGARPEAALAIAKRMVEQDHVFAFYGTQAVVTLQAVMPYLEERNIPVVGAVSGNAIEDTSPMVFNPQASPGGWGASLTAALPVLTDKKKMAVLYCREAQVCTDQRNAVRKYAPSRGLEVVYEAAVSLAQPDFTAEVISARNAGAEILDAMVDPASYVRVAKAAHRQGWTPVLAGHYGTDEEDTKAGGPDVEGLIGFSVAVNYEASERLADYRSALARFVPGGRLGSKGSLAWIQGKLLEAVAGHLQEPPTRDQLFEGLYALRGETLGGVIPPITFNRGAHLKVNTCIVPTKLVGGRWTQPLGDHFICTDLVD